MLRRPVAAGRHSRFEDHDARSRSIGRVRRLMEHTPVELQLGEPAADVVVWQSEIGRVQGIGETSFNVGLCQSIRRPVVQPDGHR